MSHYDHGGQPPALPPANWYPDPYQSTIERYWDGRAWTAYTRDRYTGQEHFQRPALAAVGPAQSSSRWVLWTVLGAGGFLVLLVVFILGLSALFAFNTPSTASRTDTELVETPLEWPDDPVEVLLEDVPPSLETEASRTEFPVFGSNTLVLHLATEMVNQNPKIDLSPWLAGASNMEDKIMDAVDEAESQNPYVFIAGYNWEWGRDYVFVLPNYVHSDEEADRRRQETRAAVANALSASGASSAGDHATAVTAIHRYLAVTAEYDWEAYDAIDEAEFGWDKLSVHELAIVARSQEAYGVLVEGYGVCTSYAEAFHLLASELGIPTVIITGDALIENQTERHAWNRVYVDGQWLVVDVTWDDVDWGAPLQDYLLLELSNPLLADRTADEFWMSDDAIHQYQ